MGDFVEVGSPILAGFAGTVHVGMDLDVIGLKIQRAIGQQVYLISILLVVGVLGSIWFVNLAAKPLGELLAFAVKLAKEEDANGAEDQRILARDDEAGELARLLLHLSQRRTPSDEPPPAADATG